MRAAATSPSSSPPTTTTQRRPSASRTTTAPSPASSEAGSTPGETSPEAASPPRPTTTSTPSAAVPRATGRSSAMVSKPRRAAISAAARVSAPVGDSPVTSEALTKSGTSSPLVSRTRPPISKSVVRSPGTEASGAWAKPARGTPAHNAAAAIADRNTDPATPSRRGRVPEPAIRRESSPAFRPPLRPAPNRARSGPGRSALTTRGARAPPVRSRQSPTGSPPAPRTPAKAPARRSRRRRRTGARSRWSSSRSC